MGLDRVGDRAALLFMYVNKKKQYLVGAIENGINILINKDFVSSTHFLVYLSLVQKQD